MLQLRYPRHAPERNPIKYCRTASSHFSKDNLFYRLRKYSNCDSVIQTVIQIIQYNNLCLNKHLSIENQVKDKETM